MNRRPITMISRYLLAWPLLAVVAIINGTLRVMTYGRYIPELAAHQVSTVTAMIAFFAFTWLLHRRWPIESTRQAWIIGACWLVMTVAFEFGFGHYVAGHSWERLLADYDLTNGRVWSLLLAWVLALPFVVFRLSRGNPGSQTPR